jgi:kynurenine 3-monooxygenase
MQKVIPMKGRMIHFVDGALESQLYDLEGRTINSIDRSFLNDLLLDEVEKLGIKIEFGHKLEKLDLSGDKSVLYFKNDDEGVEYDLVIGADGTFSKVRGELQKYIRMDYSQEYVDSAYLELSIAADVGNGFKLDKNHLHIWPRHNFMLIALPNLDGSFTSTFFAPWALIESLDTDETVLDFFKREFPDAVDLITEEKLLYAFHNHPRGKLLSIKCSSYHYEDKAVIIGDAAHAMVPFYGQGMNCGFEDVFQLLSILDSNKDLKQGLSRYSETRHEDLLAIIDLALENYKEMSHKVTSKLFVLKKSIDFMLTRLLKDKWLPLYTMVSFRSDISYSRAVKTSARQEKILRGLTNAACGLLLVGAYSVYKHLSKRR